MTIARVCAVAALVCGCVPSFEDRPWLVEQPRILGVRSIPAEARPSGSLTFEALTATPDGTGTAGLEFSYCTRPRTVAERTNVTESCLLGEDLERVPNPAVMLADGCARFGPNTPPTEGDRPAQRPADPDPSGGYYVPVHARAPELEAESFGFARVRCDLTGATRAIFDDFEARYVENVNPEIAALELGRGADRISLIDGPGSVPPGESSVLTMRPADTASEPYVVYREQAGMTFDEHESLTVRWYVTDGELELSRETLDADPLRDGSTFDATWHAPSSPTVVHGWTVLVDDRGGVAWQGFTISVEG